MRYDRATIDCHRIIHHVISWCSVMILAMTLVSCAWITDPKTADNIVTPKNQVAVLYNDALDLFQKQHYTSALEKWQSIYQDYPFSVWASRAHLMVAYSYYKTTDYAEGIAVLENYMRLYPSDNYHVYALYLQGISYYVQINDVERDQKNTKRSLDIFNQLIEQYPDSDYARDVGLKRQLARDQLAGKEMSVGRYYQRRQQYISAINRYKTVVDSYQTTSHIPEALSRLVESYLALGWQEEAKKVASVLGHNYNSSDWYQDSYTKVTDPAPFLIDQQPSQDPLIADGLIDAIF